jgi:hypothetical protein
MGLVSMNAGATPSGTVGYRVKKTIISEILARIIVGGLMAAHPTFKQLLSHTKINFCPILE